MQWKSGIFVIQNGLEARFIHEMDLDTGCFTLVEGGGGGDCRNCNRLRLTANGMIKPCLFSNLEYSIRELGIHEALLQSIRTKPEKGMVNNIIYFIILVVDVGAQNFVPLCIVLNITNLK